MRRREFLYGVGGGAAGALLPVRLPAMIHAALPLSAARGVKVCVAGDADPGVRRAADAIAGTSNHPLLRAMGATPAIETSRSLSADHLADNHLILVGMPGDALINAAWQQEARATQGGMYVFGFGHLQGDIGYIESDRNPFLHSQAIKKAPFETQVVTISGSSPAGVQLAAEAFLKGGLVNGVVAAKGWTRPSSSLLERDPLTLPLVLPEIAPERLGNATRIGYTQASEDEYRGVLADTGVSPVEIWRVKYFEAGNWDGVGQEGSFDNYAAGLHRRAYGNTLWAAKFSSSSEAAQCAPKIAAAAKLKKQGSTWVGNQSPYANATYAGDSRIPGTITLAQKDAWVTMFTQQIRWVPGTTVSKTKASGPAPYAGAKAEDLPTPVRSESSILPLPEVRNLPNPLMIPGVNEANPHPGSQLDAVLLVGANCDGSLTPKNQMVTCPPRQSQVKTTVEHQLIEDIPYGRGVGPPTSAPREP